MCQLLNVKLKDFISICCVLYLCVVVERIALVMSATQKIGLNKTTMALALDDYSLEPEDYFDGILNETKLPEMVIFDLDNVIWPFFVDTDKRFNETHPTLSKQGNNSIAPFPEAKGALEYLTQNYSIGLIGQIENTSRALDLLEQFDLFRFFQFIEFGMEKKLTLIKRVQIRANISLPNILYIDYDYNKVESDEILDILYEHVFLMYIDDLGLRLKYIKHALFVFNQRPRRITKKEEVLKFYDKPPPTNRPKQIKTTQNLKTNKKQRSHNVTKKSETGKPRLINTTTNKKHK